MPKLTAAEADSLYDTYRENAPGGGTQWADATKLFVIKMRESVRRYLQDVHGFTHDESAAGVEICLHTALPDAKGAAVESVLPALREQAAESEPAQEPASE